MKYKNRLIILGSVIILLISALFLISYGFYHTIVKGNETSKKAMLSSQVIKVEFSDGTESLVSSGDDIYFYPGSTLIKTFTIENTGTVDAKYSINLTDIVNDFVRTQDLTYELKSDEEVLASGLFPTTDLIVLENEILPIETTKTYTLTINYLESIENQIEDNGKAINGSIEIG